MASKASEIIKIAQKFEDALAAQGITDFDSNMSFQAKDIYWLLCQVMSDPRNIVWGDTNMTWPEKK